jgi:hypothetical protein
MVSMNISAPHHHMLHILPELGHTHLEQSTRKAFHHLTFLV